MKLTFDMGGLKALAKKFEGMADLDAGVRQAKESAKTMTRKAQSMVYRPELLTQRDGAIKESLHPIVETDGSSISFGVETNNLVAIYHELGTGPVGTAAGYPGEGMTDEPIVRRSSPWVYWSKEAAKKNSKIDPGGNDEFSDMQSYFEYKHAGFVTTSGVPPKAFMFNAVLDNVEQETQKVMKAMLGGADRGD